MMVVQVILRDCFEIPSASRPQISEYQRSVRPHFVLAPALVHGHSHSDHPIGLVSQSGEGLDLCSAENGLAAPLAAS